MDTNSRFKRELYKLYPSKLYWLGTRHSHPLRFVYHRVEPNGVTTFHFVELRTGWVFPVPRGIGILDTSHSARIHFPISIVVHSALADTSEITQSRRKFACAHPFVLA